MGQKPKNDFMAAKNEIHQVIHMKWVCYPQNDAFVLCQMAINKHVYGVYTIKRYVINDSFVVSITFE